MHIHTHKQRVHGLEPYSGIQGWREHLWTLMDPNMYMRHKDIFPYYSLSFLPLFLHKRLYHFLHHWQLYDRFSPLSQHHILLHPPIFSCLVNILLLFIRTISPYFTCINWVDTTLYSISIWVLCSLSQHLFKVLKLAPLQPSSFWLLLPATSWSYH